VSNARPDLAEVAENARRIMAPTIERLERELAEARAEIERLRDEMADEDRGHMLALAAANAQTERIEKAAREYIRSRKDHEPRGPTCPACAPLYAALVAAVEAKR